MLLWEPLGRLCPLNGIVPESPLCVRQRVRPAIVLTLNSPEVIAIIECNAILNRPLRTTVVRNIEKKEAVRKFSSDFRSVCRLYLLGGGGGGHRS